MLGLWPMAALAASVPLPPTRPAELSPDVASSPSQSGSVAAPSASGSLPLCKGPDKSKWDNCVGTFMIENLGEYSGEIRGRKPQGTGVFKSVDGSVYQGEFRDGVPAGKGRFTSAKGAVYIGEFADGVANGEGSERAADGAQYSGYYVNGVREGKGRIIFPDGRQYEGDFVADRIEGYGTFTFPNGDNYVGVFYNGEPTDRGIFRFSNGDRYVGAFKDFKASGPGVLTFASGVKLIGSFADGRPQGPAVLYDNLGVLIYEGEIADITNVETILRDHEAKLRSKQNPVKAVENKTAAEIAPAPMSPSQPASSARSDTSSSSSALSPATSAEAVSSAASNSVVVSNLKIAPLESVDPKAPASNQSQAPADVISDTPITTPAEADQPVLDTRADNSNSSANVIGETSPNSQQKTISDPNLGLTQSQASSSTPVAQNAATIPTPLRCKRDGDLLVSFITCDVMKTEVQIDDIVFEGASCRSGRDYLADYDSSLAAPWYDFVRVFKAYFYFRPFDYRGVHRYRDKVHFLVSGCKQSRAFTIRVNGQSWTWPETGSPVLSAKEPSSGG